MAKEPTGGEQAAFLRGLAFAYRRALELLEDCTDSVVDGDRVRDIQMQMGDAVRIAEAAVGEISTGGTGPAPPYPFCRD